MLFSIQNANTSYAASNITKTNEIKWEKMINWDRCQIVLLEIFLLLSQTKKKKKQSAEKKREIVELIFFSEKKFLVKIFLFSIDTKVEKYFSDFYYFYLQKQLNIEFFIEWRRYFSIFWWNKSTFFPLRLVHFQTINRIEHWLFW